MLGLGHARCRSRGRKAGIGAISLDRDLGDVQVHTWPHSHFLMQISAKQVQNEKSDEKKEVFPFLL